MRHWLTYTQEGPKAFKRLQEEIIKTSTDHTILAWDSRSAAPGELLAASPSDFTKSDNIVTWGIPAPLEMTARGLRASLPIWKPNNGRDECFAILNCCMKENIFSSVALRVRPYHGLNTYHVLEPNGDEDEFSRLSLVDATLLEGTSSSVVEIMRESKMRNGRAKQLKLCIYIAEGSYPAEITKTETSWSAEKFGWNTKSVVVGPTSTAGRFAALVKFESGEEVVVLLVFEYTAVSYFGVHTWCVHRENGEPELWQLINKWDPPKGCSLFPHASLFDIPGKRVTANLTGRVISGEGVIEASVSMKDNKYL